jgi:hypothetical protein
MNGINLEKQM